VHGFSGHHDAASSLAPLPVTDVKEYTRFDDHLQEFDIRITQSLFKQGMNLSENTFPAACSSVSERIQMSSSLPLAAESFNCRKHY